MIEACRKENLVNVITLLEKGTDINVKYYGDTLLNISSFHGYLEIIKLLLKYGANVKAKNEGKNTPLHIPEGC